MTLQQRIFLFGAFFISTAMVVSGILFYMTISDAIEEQVGKRALDIAATSAQRPDILEGFSSANPVEALQPIAEEIRNQTGAEYVVIGNKDGIRYSHPLPDRLGKKMVGDDNDRALVQGLSYVSEATGSLGAAKRRFSMMPAISLV